MLQARNHKGQMINLLQEIPAERQEFFCPLCQNPVRLRQGEVMRAHFAHVSLKNCHFFSENESQEHLALKEMLYQVLLAKGEEVALEAPIKEVSQVADVLVNRRIALEVQCSRLSLKRLKERTLAYHQAGYYVCWLLGKELWLKDRLTALHRHLLYFSKNMGFYLWELDLDFSQIRLKYLIHEDLRGKVHYLKKSWSLSDFSLAVLRLPFFKQPLSCLEVKVDKEIKTYIQRQLFYGSKRWLKEQEVCYLKGQNLLNQDLNAFFPQVRPPSLEAGFLQVQEQIGWYYQHFLAYYQRQKEKQRQILYPPAFYDKIK